MHTIRKREQTSFPSVVVGYIIVRKISEQMRYLSSVMTWSPFFNFDYAHGYVHSKEALPYIRQCSEALWPDNAPTHVIRAIYVPEHSGLFEGHTILVDEAANRDNLLIPWEEVFVDDDDDE